MGKMDGKTVLITGGGSGIGRASVDLLASEGARVLVVDRNSESAESAAEDAGNGAVAFTADVSKMADLDRLFEEVATHTDCLDVVFANAGIAELAPIGAITEDHFDRQFAVNVKGTLFTVQNALPLVPNGGSIILTSSVGQKMGMQAFGTYGASKAAVRSFARNWTIDLKPRGIRVNALSPGPTETQLGADMGLTDEDTDTLANLIPLGRLGHATETAQAVLFLASGASSFITGIELCVDGGLAQI